VLLGIQNAMDAAKFERELQDQKRSKTKDQNQEREINTQERYQKAKEKVQFEKEQAELYKTFDTAAKVERERRLNEVENAVIATRTVEYANNENAKQRKMERIFERELLLTGNTLPNSLLIVTEPDEPVVITTTIDGNVPVYTAETVYPYPYSYPPKKQAVEVKCH
jgi:pyruvate/2-oxoglutarate dehydrogenase complex dihydrolipoamide dehydrogenase (E3) component